MIRWETLCKIEDKLYAWYRWYDDNIRCYVSIDMNSDCDDSAGIRYYSWRLNINLTIFVAWITFYLPGWICALLPKHNRKPYSVKANGRQCRARRKLTNRCEHYSHPAQKYEFRGICDGCPHRLKGKVGRDMGNILDSLEIIDNSNHHYAWNNVIKNQIIKDHPNPTTGKL